MTKQKPRLKPNKGSWPEFLLTLDIGQSCYYETTPSRYESDSSIILLAKSRRTPSTVDLEVTTKLLTCISSSVKDEIIYLLKITRIK